MVLPVWFRILLKALRKEIGCPLSRFMVSPLNTDLHDMNHGVFEKYKVKVSAPDVFVEFSLIPQQPISQDFIIFDLEDDVQILLN